MRYYNVHTHQSPTEGLAIVQSQGEYIDQFHSVGIHPWDTDLKSMTEIQNQIKHPKCLALGEIGLDRLRGPILAKQRDVFKQQLALANAYKKPVILHIVRAWNELYALLPEFQKTPWILHGFNNPKQLKALLQTPLYLSMGPSSLENPQMREVLPQIPPHRLLFETDDAPQSIAWVYEQYAKLTMQPLVDLCLQIEQNILAIFGPWEIG